MKLKGMNRYQDRVQGNFNCISDFTLDTVDLKRSDHPLISLQWPSNTHSPPLAISIFLNHFGHPPQIYCALFQWTLDHLAKPQKERMWNEAPACASSYGVHSDRQLLDLVNSNTNTTCWSTELYVVSLLDSPGNRNNSPDHKMAKIYLMWWLGLWP